MKEPNKYKYFRIEKPYKYRYFKMEKLYRYMYFIIKKLDKNIQNKYSFHIFIIIDK